MHVVRGRIDWLFDVCERALPVPRKLALRMLFTGEAITAQEALTGGLVSELCADAAALQTRVATMAKAMARQSPHVVALGKRTVLKQVTRAYVACVCRDALTLSCVL